MDKDRSLILLKAASDILHKANDSFYVLETMAITAEWDGVECDANCLMEEIDSLLEDANPTEPEKLKSWSELTEEDAIEIGIAATGHECYEHVNQDREIIITYFDVRKDDETRKNFISFLCLDNNKNMCAYDGEDGESLYIDFSAATDKARELGYDI